ncbi:MAG: hypothetical protein M3279_00105 [Actinomycetota bacterium]|nr:hypothetical protein [Actinomycetota bacterium]
MRHGRAARLVLTSVLLALALAGPAPASHDSGQRPGRVQSHQYLYSHGVDTWHWKVSAEDLLPPIVFEPRPGDEWLHLAVDDAAGYPVFVRVRQEAPGGAPGLDTHFCARAGILRLRSAEPVEVYLFSGVCQNHTSGIATTGTLTATFTRRL